jgi:hypothetical protein
VMHEIIQIPTMHNCSCSRSNTSQACQRKQSISVGWLSYLLIQNALDYSMEIESACHNCQFIDQGFWSDILKVIHARVRVGHVALICELRLEVSDWTHRYDHNRWLDWERTRLNVNHQW